MCRHLAWLGAPRSVASLVLERPHGLLQQSWAPRRQNRGLLNADGWGVGFYAAGRPEPVRWRSARPLWGETSFASVAPVLTSGAVLAAVRSATEGMPTDESAAAPFTDGRWLLSHNGRVDRAVLPPRRDAESVCDSAVLAAHVFAEGPERVAETVRAVAALDPGAFLTLLLTDGTRVTGVTWGDSLCYLERIDRVFDAIASAEQADLVGFCLDTCHAHAGGNDLTTVVEDVKRVTGRIDLVHCNDSRDEFDSGADRHTSLGAGKIDPELLVAVIRDAGAPVVCETPGGPEEHRADFAWLRERL